MSELLPINEVFESVQGEGYWTGTPAVFIRLQGCDVGCPWCDTKHTWHHDFTYAVPKEEMLAKPGDAPTFATLSVEELLDVCAKGPRHVVITGGEPCDNDLVPLTLALNAAGHTVQIETSGTSHVRVAEAAWVTLSPKIDMPGGKTVRPDALARANEIKMPVGKPDDIIKLTELLATMPRKAAQGDSHAFALVWLQPLSQSAKATALCVYEATKRDWRLSLQTHKYMGVR